MKCCEKMITIHNAHPVLVNSRHPANAAMPGVCYIVFNPILQMQRIGQWRTTEVEPFVTQSYAFNYSARVPS